MTTEATEGTIAKEKIVQDFKTVYSDVEELLRATATQTGEKIGVLRERLEAVFVPRRVVHVNAFPREGTGKLTVKSLREFALAHLASELMKI